MIHIEVAQVVSSHFVTVSHSFSSLYCQPNLLCRQNWRSDCVKCYWSDCYNSISIVRSFSLIVDLIWFPELTACYNFDVSLSVSGGTQTQNETDGDSTASVTVADSKLDTSGPTVHSSSATFRALQEMESGVSSSSDQSATHRPLKDGEEMKYHGYTNPHKQSRSFQMLEQGLRMSERGQGVSAFVFQRGNLVHVPVHLHLSQRCACINTAVVCRLCVFLTSF